MEIMIKMFNAKVNIKCLFSKKMRTEKKKSLCAIINNGII